MHFSKPQMRERTVGRWRRMQMEEKAFRGIGGLLVCLFALACAIPFLIVLSSSFSEEREIIRHGYSLFPRGFTLDSYRAVLRQPGQIIRAYGVTVLVTAAGTAGSVFINTMTGYVLQRKDFEWRNRFSFYFFFTTLFSGGLVPWYILCVKYLHLSNNILALILPSLVSVWNLLLVKGFMAGIPFEITESGKIDGAGDFTIFIRLIIPLAKPVIATIGLFTALLYWNDWYSCMLFISDEVRYNLQYLLYRMVGSAEAMRNIMAQTGADMDIVPIEAMKMTLTVIVTGPIVFLYPLIQKYFVKGLTIGAVKG